MLYGYWKKKYKYKFNKIQEIVIGTNNVGKYKEICDLLPNKVKKYSPKEFGILTPEETGESFEKNSFIKASYYSKKTNLVCLSDDSGLEIDLLKGEPGIYSSRWSGNENNFNIAIEKIFEKMNNKKGIGKKIIERILFVVWHFFGLVVKTIQAQKL